MNRMLYVYKSMLNKLQNVKRNDIIFLLFVLMLSSLFFSRAVLSLSLILFIIFSVAHTALKKQLHTFFHTPVLWGMSLLFFIPFISGSWSADQQQWQQIVRIKLPLVVLPFAFAAPFVISKKQGEWLSILFIGLVMAGTCWSLFHYFSDMKAVHEGYLRAKTIVTPLENDRVRFSWLVSIAFLLAGWLGWQQFEKRKKPAFVFFILAAWFGIYLHILAVRTGLFSFYAILLVFVMVAVLQQISWKKSRWHHLVIIMLLVLLLPFAAYYTLPTFHNRVRYIRYDYGYFQQAHYLPGGNDATRVISIKAGWQIMLNHPVAGVGFGDIKKEANKWYTTHYPEMREEDKIVPGSEWMVYGAGAGIPGVIIFSLALLLPFFAVVRHKICWVLLHLTAAGSFIVDIGLEVQFGVFVYAFLVLWWWKWWKN